MSFGASKGKSTNKGTSTTTSNPWAPTIDPTKGAIGDAEDMYSSGGMQIDPYTGERVAGMSDATQTGMSMLQQPNEVSPLAFNAWQAMLDPTDDTAMRMRSGIEDRTKSSLAGMFAGGNTNNSLAGPEAARSMSNALAEYEYSSRLAALGMTPQMMQAGQQDTANMLTAGGMTDAYNQAGIDADMGQHYEGQNAPIDALARYSALLGGFGGMGGTQTGKTRSSGTQKGFNFGFDLA